VALNTITLIHYFSYIVTVSFFGGGNWSGQMKVRVLKLKSVNSKLCGSRSFRGSLVIYDSNNDVMYCCLQKGRLNICWQNWICWWKKVYTFIIIKVWNMKNVLMWSLTGNRKKPIPQLSIFCLIQGNNNYIHINTYWSYIEYDFWQVAFFCWRLKWPNRNWNKKINFKTNIHVQMYEKIIL
jgi:hypothetical protein